MNKGLIFSLGVVVGVGGGGWLASRILKDKYAQKADDEITACRNAFLAELDKRRAEGEAKEKEARKEKAEEAVQTYSPEPEKAKEMVHTAEEHKEVYEIALDVYNDPRNPYKQIGLMYFPGDGIIAKDDGEIMTKEQVESTIGLSALAKFSDGDTDQVVMRNDRLKIDYEINLFSIGYAKWKQKFSSSGK